MNRAISTVLAAFSAVFGHRSKAEINREEARKPNVIGKYARNYSESQGYFVPDRHGTITRKGQPTARKA